MSEIKIPTAAEARGRTIGGEGKFDDAVMSQLQKIEKACHDGVHHCVWIFYDDSRYEDFEDRATKMFLEKGFLIRPMGVCGGVVQRGKYLCW